MLKIKNKTGRIKWETKVGRKRKMGKNCKKKGKEQERD